LFEQPFISLNHPKTILKKYWGHDDFRPMQEDIINSVLQKKDVLALLPTGGGKSICFQVPALMMDGICLVVTPLIALMKDQVENLRKKGIYALAIHAGMSYPEVKRTLQNAAFGNYKFLYLSPERLESDLFEEFLPAIQPCLVAVDEAHCISQWGYDFRPSYLKIAAIREQLPDTPVIALTASATSDVQDDICRQLLFSNHQVRFQGSFSRPKLAYRVMQAESKTQQIISLLQQTKGSAIIYCKSRKITQQLSTLLNNKGLSADFYHAGLNTEDRSRKQQAWLNNQTQTMVCTNAFGMGIDKPDVRLVLHYNVPESLEYYYQEAGRAGRDNLDATAILFAERQEMDQLFQNCDLKYPDHNTLRQLYFDLMNYLRVPAGSGEGQTYDFVLSEFADRFKWNPIQANYGLQSLAQEGLIYLTESVFIPSAILVTADRFTIYDLEHQQPELDVVIKGLLRSYEGIMDFPARVSEKALSGFLQIPLESLIERLKRMDALGLIEYRPRQENPQIYLLLDRMYQDDFRLNVNRIQERKQKHLNRIRGMENYVNETKRCRSKMIGAYFNDHTLGDCGICDNCTEGQKGSIKNDRFKLIYKGIEKTIKQQPMNKKALLAALSKFQKNEVEAILSHMVSEGLILGDRNGELFWA
jgi:ATP-dependent DNA helicase RecQ